MNTRDRQSRFRPCLAVQCAGLVALWGTPVFGQGSASVNIELPIVGVTSVQTTVTVPTGGAVYLGGLKRAADAQRHAGPSFPGFLPSNSARSRFGSATGMSTSALILDSQELEEEVSWRVADRLWATGRVANAIDNFRAIAARSTKPSIRGLAKGRLERLRQEGMAKYAAARNVASKTEAARQVDHVLRQYGTLILTPGRRAEQRRLADHPEVAQLRHGAETDRLLAKAQQSLTKGKLELARVYYRMAAKHPGTRSGALAAVALARLERVRSTSGPVVAIRSPSVSSDGNAAGRLVDLARLYRSINPTKSREFYRQALLSLPADSRGFAQLSREARLVADPTGNRSSGLR